MHQDFLSTHFDSVVLRVSGRFLLASKRMKASDSKMITATEAACVLFNFFCICVRRQHFRLIKISPLSLFSIHCKTTQAGQRPEKNGHFRVIFLGTSACCSCEDIVSPLLGSGTQLRCRRFAIPHPKWRVDDVIRLILVFVNGCWKFRRHFNWWRLDRGTEHEPPKICDIAMLKTKIA